MTPLTLVLAAIIALSVSVSARETDEAAARDRSDSNPQAALREKLGDLIEAGKITRQEAGELYRAAFPEGRRAMERRRYETRRAVELKDPASFDKDNETPIFSGPQPGEKLAAFQAASLAGETKDHALDPVALAGGRPQILIFQDEAGVAIRGLYQVSAVIGKIDRRAKDDLHIACVFLSDDPADLAKFSRAFPGLLERGVDVVAFSKDGREGPGAYGLDRSVSQTILLAKDGKVVHNFVFPQGMLYADPHVMGGIAELIGETRETVAAWLNEEPADGAKMRRR